MRKVLVLEDEENIRSFVVINLKRAGYTTIEAGCGMDALAALKANPDIKVALLDIMLPDMDGFEVCRRIRAMDNKIGIIMLTARTQEMDKVTGLMTGADDYVTKPFSPAELTARVDALFRRTGGEEPPVPFLSIYRLTGTNRAAASTRAGRFVLREEGSVIYSAKLYDTKFKSGVDETKLMEYFHTIRSNWQDD